MSSIVGTLGMFIQSGLGSLASYLAAHVLLCLLPAFLIAGALAALIPQGAITQYLGRKTPKWISYPAAAVGGFVLAVCSCTIMPLFAGIYKKGAGLGPAITFLFVGPAVNILAISLTGVAVGADIALARIILSITFGILIGLLMAWIFRKEDIAHEVATAQDAFATRETVPARTWAFFALLLAVLMAGTLQIAPLTRSYVTLPLGSGSVIAASEQVAPVHWAYTLQSWLDRVLPPNPALGVEGVSVQGVFLIGLLMLIGVTSWRGLEHVDEAFNSWTPVALGLVTLTLLVASLKVTVTKETLFLGVTGKFLVEAAVLAGLWWLALKVFEPAEIQDWLWEMWRFVKQIMPLLLVGVFFAGAARALIPAQWVTAVAGRNTLLANLAGVTFGVFMYFPTLVEVPIAQTFLALGMQRGPLLAYLLADPELSLQSILITQSIIGKTKAWTYVAMVAVFSTLSGLIFGLVVH